MGVINNCYTQAIYPIWINGEKHFYVSNYVSIIDVHYKRYILM